ncbi:MAG: UDP-N-acetylmuramate dehydrogenase [Acidobacteria bacterium]|nr:UDP-N-acetylmuramate dehydrogenase [Acidobacteriota bacterium]
MIVPPPVPHRFREPLAPYTTWKIGGPADVLLEPPDVNAFRETLRWALNEGLPVTVLGGGSNILVSDAGVEGAVILTTRLERLVPLDSDQTGRPGMEVEAGATMEAVCREAVRLGLAGLEVFHGLPGTVGGAVFMNARCWERSISERIESVRSLDDRGEWILRPASGCDFAYKQSIFQRTGEAVASVRLRLDPAPDREALERETEGYRKRREDAGQYAFPNAGCVFKNDRNAGRPSGRIIDGCGLRGYRTGPVEVYARHANFIVNRGGATAREVLDAIRLVEETVLARTGVRLEREIRLIGRWRPEDHVPPPP